MTDELTKARTAGMRLLESWYQHRKKEIANKHKSTDAMRQLDRQQEEWKCQILGESMYGRNL